MDETSLASAESAVRAIRDTSMDGHFYTACLMADEAVERFPESPELAGIAASLLAWRGRSDDAELMLNRVSGHSEGGAYYWAGRADVATFVARLQEGREAADRASALSDSDPWVIERCASVYLCAGEFDTAISLAQRWRELSPDDARPLAHLRTMLMASAREHEAAKVLEEARTRFPDSPRTLAKLGQEALRQMRVDEAVELYRRAVEGFDDAPFVLSEYAQALSFANKLQEADALADKALSMSSCASVAMLVKARVCRVNGDAKGAAEWERKAHSAIPALKAQSALTRANAALRARNWRKAVRIVDDALPDLMPGSRAVALQAKARALIAINDLTEAARTIDELRELRAESPAFYDLNAALRFKRRDLEGAAAILSAGISRFPMSGALRVRLLSVLHGAGARVAEEDLVKRVMAEPPQLVSEIGQVLIALGETGHKIEFHTLLTSARAQHPHAGELQVIEAMGKLSDGDVQTARELLSRTQGEWTPIARRIRFASTLVGAMRWLAKLVRPGPRDERK